MVTNRGVETSYLRDRKWNPYLDIEFYAPYSEKIAKLKLVIDTLASCMGHKQLGL